MRKMLSLAAIAALAVVVTGCPKKKTEEKPKISKAGAVFESKSGSKVTGSATFEEAGDGRLKITINVQNAAPGDHGIHIHEKGDCSAADASSAGDHFNPGEGSHGPSGGASSHAGDLGNINVKADGTGTTTLTSAVLKLEKGKWGVVDRAIIFHEKADDLATQPGGNAGGRVACGVINPL